MAKDAEISLNLKVDAAEAQRTLADLQNKAQNVQPAGAAQGDGGAGMEKYGEAVQKVTGALTEFAEALLTTNAGLDEQTAAALGLSGSYEEISAKIDALKKQFIDLGNAAEYARQGQQKQQEQAEATAEAEKNAHEEYEEWWSKELDMRDRQRQQQDDEQYRMQLATMSVQQLTEELQRLNEQRRAAAAANDAEALDAVTKKMGMAQQQLRQLTQARNVDKAAMFGQVQAGLQFGQQLASLAKGLESGEMSLSDFTGQVISLGMALRAMQGPLGWVMAGVQLLSVVITKYAARQEEARKVTEAQRASLHELSKELHTLNDRMVDFNREQDNAARLKQVTHEYEKIAEATGARVEAVKKLAAAQQAANEEQKRDRSREAALQELDIQYAVLTGLKDEKQARRELAELKLKTAKDDLDAATEKARIDADAAKDALEAARRRDADVQEENEKLNKEQQAFAVDPAKVRAAFEARNAIQEAFKKAKAAADSMLAEGMNGDEVDTQLLRVEKLATRLNEANAKIRSVSATAAAMGNADDYEREYKAVQERSRLAVEQSRAAREAVQAATREAEAKRTAYERTRKDNGRQADFLQKQFDAQQRNLEQQQKNAEEEAKKAKANEKARRKAEELARVSESIGLDRGRVRKGASERDTVENARGSFAKLTEALEAAAASRDTLADDKQLMQWLAQNQQVLEQLAGKSGGDATERFLAALRELTATAKTANDKMYSKLASETRRLANQIRGMMQQ